MILLQQREKTHGDYEDVAHVAQSLKSALRGGPIEELPLVHRESLDMICTKMARIVCGDHYERDHLIDIIGYAQLVLDHIKKVQPGSLSIQEPDDEPQDASIGDDWDYQPPVYKSRSGISR